MRRKASALGRSASSPRRLRTNLSAKQIHLWRRGEALELFAVVISTRRTADIAFRRKFGFFEITENLFGAFQNRFRHPSQPGNLNAVALVRAALDDFAQEHYLVVPFTDGHIEILQPRQSAR